MFISFALFMVVGALILLFDLVLGLGLALDLARAFRLARRGTETSGTVTQIVSPRPGRTTRVEVSYQTPGGQFQIKDRSATPRVGEAIPVRYDPSRPQRATAILQPARQALTRIPAVLVVAVIGAGMLVGAIWYFSGTHSSLQFPIGGGAADLGLIVMCAWHANDRFAALRGSRGMVTADGAIQRFDERSPVGRSFLIAFQAPDGPEEFRAPARSVQTAQGKTVTNNSVTVYYTPGNPGGSATVESPKRIRSQAIKSVIAAVAWILLALVVFLMMRTLGTA